MLKLFTYVTGVVIIIHGLIHLMGFVAYWPLAKVAELPYKTTLLDGRWHVGETGMRIFAALWLIVALAFLVSAVALFARRSWVNPVLVSTICLSTLLVAMDWAGAFRGAIVNVVLLVLMILVCVSNTSALEA